MPIQQRSPVLLATDQSASVLHHFGAGYARAVTYSPFGFHSRGLDGILSGFNGQALETVTLGYLLGNGYRHFNPVLQRFSAPDSLSPFGDGGINAYVYCAGDPQNLFDPSGHVNILKGLKNIFTKRQSTTSMINDMNLFRHGVAFGNTEKTFAIASKKLKKGELGLSVAIEKSFRNVKTPMQSVAEVSTTNIHLVPKGVNNSSGQVKLTRPQVKELARQVRQDAADQAEISALARQAFITNRRTPRAHTGKELSNNIRNKEITASRFQ